VLDTKKFQTLISKLYSRKNQSPAIEILNREPHTRRGISYDKLGQYDKAVEDFSVAIRLDPTNANLLFNRGSALDRSVTLTITTRHSAPSAE
jgi:tetratricopeptide (TPR) repeat protein